MKIIVLETLSVTHAVRGHRETGTAGVAMLDLSWCAGLAEARNSAALAESHHVPVAPHDCTGPVVYAASCHLRHPDAVVRIRCIGA